MTKLIKLRDTAEQPTNSPLGALNQLFHKEFQHWQDTAQQTIMNGGIPVVVRLDDRLILVKGKQEYVYQINGDRYHELKAISHIPLAVYLILARSRNDRQELLTIIDQLARLPDWLHSLKIYTDSLKCAVEQLADSVAADGDVLAHEAVRKFAHQLKPIFHSLVADAALDEVTQLMTAMASIKLRVSDAQQWSQAFFVICAGHQPRYKQITKRFFERWLLEETHSDLEAVHRVIYAESCQTLGEALQLVSTRIVSANLGEIFFHSPLSLDEDVLGDAGLAAIDRLFCNREI